MSDKLSILKTWMLSNCDGDWEHEYGIKIETIDNPGWSITIDLYGTPLEGLSFYKTEYKGVRFWYEIVVKHNVFKAFGSDLSKLIDIFYYEFLIPNLKISKFTYSIYAKIPKIVPHVWRVLTAKMLDVNTFEIVEVLELNWEMLKVKQVEDFGNLNFSQISNSLPYQKGDVVKCRIVKMFDYPALVITKKVKTAD